MNLDAASRVTAAAAVAIALVTSLSTVGIAQNRPEDPDTAGPDDPDRLPGETAPVPFSPEQLSWLLPADIGGIEMGALDQDPDEVEARLEDSSSLREMLETAGKDPAELHLAEGFNIGGPDAIWYRIDAFRVDGWTGRDALRHLLDPQLRASDRVDTALALTSRRLDDGREVFVFDDDGTAFQVAFPDGDVLYLISAEGGLGLDDFMTEASFGGQRVAVQGIALTAPQPWWVEPTDASSHSWLYGSTWDGLVYLYDAEFSCAVIDVTAYATASGFRTVDDAVTWELQAFDEMGVAATSRLLRRLSVAPSNVTSEILDLPAGRTGVIDIAEPEWWNSRTYIMSDDGRWVFLHCSDTFEPPPDHWLSIAETFEFLPAEE